MQTPQDGQEASFASVNDRPGVQDSLGRCRRVRAAPLQEACVSVSSRFGHAIDRDIHRLQILASSQRQHISRWSLCRSSINVVAACSALLPRCLHCRLAGCKLALSNSLSRYLRQLERIMPVRFDLLATCTAVYDNFIVLSAHGASAGAVSYTHLTLPTTPYV